MLLKNRYRLHRVCGLMVALSFDSGSVSESRSLLFNGVSRFIQGDVVTGASSASGFWRNEIEQVAFAARVSAVRIAVIETTERVLEDGFWQPRCANRSAISSLLNEVEFPLENFENIATIFSHANQTSSSSLV